MIYMLCFVVFYSLPQFPANKSGIATAIFSTVNNNNYCSGLYRRVGREFMLSGLNDCGTELYHSATTLNYLEININY